MTCFGWLTAAGRSGQSKSSSWEWKETREAEAAFLPGQIGGKVAPRVEQKNIYLEITNRKLPHKSQTHTEGGHAAWGDTAQGIVAWQRAQSCVSGEKKKKKKKQNQWGLQYLRK